MKAEYVNAFLAPAQMVWEKELHCPLEFVGAEMILGMFTTSELTVTIGVSGELEGSVLYGFGKGTGLALAGRMMGETIVEHNDLSLSAVGELANMITGNAATQLSNAGYRCTISPPIMIEMIGSRIATVGGTQILATFNSELGDLTIRISLKESQGWGNGFNKGDKCTRRKLLARLSNPLKVFGKKS